MPVEVKGLKELRKALRKFTPELAKECNKELAAALKPLTRNARGFLPANDEVPSGWLKRENAGGKWATRFYDQAIARKGIVYSTALGKANKQGFRSVATIYNKSAAGAIYETAGRKTGGQQGNSANPQAGQKFIEELNKSGQLANADYRQRVGRHTRKKIGRVIFRAFSEDNGKTTAAVMKALEHQTQKTADLVNKASFN
jgi:hypothetical protein